jgi:diaminohydroxyphosphoribosylaminopyrimidine deaminase/5-amino-6-(5-phosphoribosylamino)uracil reductase
MADNADIAAMRRALALARKGLGLTSPNPPVGAVIVRDGAVLGSGWHKRAGRPHAEIEAINDAHKNNRDLRGATLYVTLEPCCTHGRTPPCTEAIVREKFSRVVIGCLDPNPRHAGRAIPLLQAAGIGVTEGVLRDDCRWLIRTFAKHVTTGLPWVVAKLAMSLDARIAPAPGRSRMLSGPEAHRFAHRLRLESDAIVVGAGTVRADDPALTIRHVRCPAHKAQPWRIILTRSGDIPASARVLRDEHRSRTMVVRSSPWPRLLKKLGAEGVQNVLIEGGGKTVAGALEAAVVDELHLIVCPVVLGGPIQAIAIEKWLKVPMAARMLSPRRLGGDVLVSAVLARDFLQVQSRAFLAKQPGSEFFEND